MVGEETNRAVMFGRMDCMGTIPVQDSPGKVKVSCDPYNFVFTRVNVYGIQNYAFFFVEWFTHACNLSFLRTAEEQALDCLADRIIQPSVQEYLFLYIQGQVIIHLVGKIGSNFYICIFPIMVKIENLYSCLLDLCISFFVLGIIFSEPLSIFLYWVISDLQKYFFPVTDFKHFTTICFIIFPSIRG